MSNYEDLLEELTRRIDDDRESARERFKASVAEGNESASSFYHGESVALSIVLSDIKELIHELETSKAAD